MKCSYWLKFPFEISPEHMTCCVNIEIITFFKIVKTYNHTFAIKDWNCLCVSGKSSYICPLMEHDTKQHSACSFWPKLWLWSHRQWWHDWRSYCSHSAWRLQFCIKGKFTVWNRMVEIVATLFFVLVYFLLGQLKEEFIFDLIQIKYRSQPVSVKFTLIWSA